MEKTLSALVRRSRLYAIADQLDQLVRRDRGLRDVHAEWLQRVLDGGDYRSRRRNRADLARALGAERIERRWRLLVERQDCRHFHRARQQVIGKGGGDGLPAFVITHPFQDRI